MIKTRNQSLFLFFDRSVFQNHALATRPPTLVVGVVSLANGVSHQLLVQSLQTIGIERHNGGSDDQTAEDYHQNGVSGPLFEKSD